MSLDMVLYPFVASLTLDASSGNVVGGATGEVFAKADTTFTTPLAAVDASGNPVTLTSNANGVLPSFYVDGHTSVNWVSGSWVFPLVTSEPVEGPEGPAGVSVNGATATGDDLVFSLSNGSTTPPVKLPTGAGGSDAGVASYITTPGTETAAALSATIAEQASGKAFNATDDNLRHWRAALAAQQSNTVGTANPARLLYLGDSITYGAGMNAYTMATPERMRQIISHSYGSAGTGIVHMLVPTGFQQDGSNNVDNRVNRIGTWTLEAKGAFGAGAISATGTASKLAFTETGTEFVVYYVKAVDAGTISVSVDGGAATTVDTNGADGYGQHTVTGLSNASHVITVTAPATGKAIIHGFEARTGLTGVRVTRCGNPGAVVADALGESRLVAEIDLAVPDLTVICLQTNDYVNSHVAVNTYQTSLTTIVQRAKLTGDVVLKVTPPPADTTSTPTFAQYTKAIYDVAKAEGCVVIDMQKRWDSWVEANALGLMQDNFHPSAIGYLDMAMADTEVLVPSASVLPAVALSVAQLFTAKQTFGAGVNIANGQTLQWGTDAMIQRDSAFVLSTNGNFKIPNVLAGGAASVIGSVTAKGAVGKRAIATLGSDNVERAGFSATGRIFSHATDNQATVGAAGTAAALPAAPAHYIKIEDNSGNVFVVPAYPAT